MHSVGPAPPLLSQLLDEPLLYPREQREHFRFRSPHATDCNKREATHAIPS